MDKKRLGIFKKIKIQLAIPNTESRWTRGHLALDSLFREGSFPKLFPSFIARQLILLIP